MIKKPIEQLCRCETSNLLQKQLAADSGPHPVFGAAGEITRVDFYQQEKPYIGVVKDGAGIGRAMKLPGMSSTIGTMMRLVPSDGVELGYLFHAFQSLHLADHRTGSTIPHIYFRNFKNTLLPCPEPDKQHAIASVFDLVCDLIAKSQAQLAHLDALAKSQFVEMFGDTATNPLHWNVATIKSCSQLLSDGPFGSNLKSSHYVDSGVRVIRLQNIGVGVFLDSDKAFISKEHYESLKRFTCRPGEVVIGTLGEPNLRACVVPSSIECAINKSDCVHLIPKHDLLLESFVVAFINSPGTLSLVAGDIHGQTRSRVSSGQLAKMPIFLPPIHLQRTFAERIARIDKSKYAILRWLSFSAAKPPPSPPGAGSSSCRDGLMK